MWFRQPDFSQTQCCLLRADNNSRVGIGRGNGSSNFPALVNNFNALTDWESAVDVYGDNKTHQLIEAHSSDTDYIIYLDGIPVASGTNTGWLDNVRKYLINGEQSNAVDELSRSGGDFGSLIDYKGGERFTQIMVRKLFEASALAGHDMLTAPQWFILDGENVDAVLGTGDKDIELGDVADATGCRSGAIPRNGKVYFEIECLAQGDNQAGPVAGIRRLVDDQPVGGDCEATPNGFWVRFGSVNNGFDDVFPGQAAGLGFLGTGSILNVALDFDNGEYWMGINDTYAGFAEPPLPLATGNPSTGAAPYFFDPDQQWAAHVRTNSNLGNCDFRLVTADADLNFTKPTGYTAWEDAI